MNRSEEVIEMLESTMFKEINGFEEIGEDTVEFLTLLGLEEGVDFTINDGDILLPPSVGLDENFESFQTLVHNKWPDIEFVCNEDSVTATYKNLEDEPMKINLPLPIYQIVKHHSIVQ
jgi:hypothetical protein